jgi:hypothetical protein
MRRRVRLTAGLGIHGDRDQPKGNAGEYENVRNDSTPNALEIDCGRPPWPEKEADDENGKDDRNDDGNKCRIDVGHVCLTLEVTGVPR